MINYFTSEHISVIPQVAAIATGGAGDVNALVSRQI